MNFSFKCLSVTFLLHVMDHDGGGPVLWPDHRYRSEITEPVLSLSRHGTPIGGIWVFVSTKVTVICQVRMYCFLSIRINTPEMPHGAQRSWMHLFAFVTACLVSKTQIPQIGLELYGWQSHYTDSIGVLGSPLYICGWDTENIFFNIILGHSQI